MLIQSSNAIQKMVSTEPIFSISTIAAFTMTTIGDVVILNHTINMLEQANLEKHNRELRKNSYLL
jgi:hypothetical protein